MAYQIHSANYDFFEKIDSEEKAYWLGFITADGCIIKRKDSNSKSVSIGLGLKDIDHLKKFKNDIEATQPIHTRKNACKITITSSKMFDDLKQYGITERKSNTLIPPDRNLIPESLFMHYIRGYFDGDGGFTVSDKYPTFSVNFCGTPEICKFILKELKVENIKLNYKKETINFASFKIKGNKQALKIANMIYSDATIYLERKFNQYKDLIIMNEINELISEIDKFLFDIKQFQIIEMLNKGFTGTEIAKEFKCGETNLTRYVKDYRNKEKEDKKKIVLDLYESGMTNKSEIHRITGFSRDYIRKIIKQVN